MPFPEILASNLSAAVLIVLAVLAGLAIGCRTIIACWLGLTAIRTAEPKDIASVLAAIGELIKAASRIKQ